MSDRRPPNPERPLFAGCPTHPEHADRKHDYMGNLSNYGDPCSFQIEPATSADLLAELRRGVESGTIKGERVAWCERHRATGASDSEGYGVCWFIMFAELMPKAYPDWSEHASHLPCKMTEPYGALVIPVSDGGEDRP